MGDLEVVRMKMKQRTIACSHWQALSAGDLGIGSFIFDRPSNSVAEI